MVAPIVNTGIQTAKYCNVAGLGALIFDYFLTLEPEVRWTWNRRWNVTRVLFVISRYMAFAAAGMTSYGEQLPVPPAAIATRANQDCHYFDKASNGAIHIISIVAAEGLLIIRTYAFWKQNKKLLAILLVLAALPPQATAILKQVVTLPFNTAFSWPTNCFDMSRAEALLPVVSVVNIVIMYRVPISYDEMMDVPQLVLHIILCPIRIFRLSRVTKLEDAVTKHDHLPLHLVALLYIFIILF
ncbi:hypothetical protein EDB19DRAFT_1828811 [Suillus lakei]|nr:hypothetical protein EDB19DRAFT_1828811 [Suillus lakei]